MATLATAPLELVRTRQAMMGSTSSSGFLGLWSDLKQIIKVEGTAALFMGIGPTLWRDLPFSAIYWFSIERFKLQWKDRIEHHHPTLVQQAGQAFLNGAAAGMIAAACTAPFDVVKTWRQTNMMMINKLNEFEEVNLHP
jgi:solute carrier family 25, member 39/40